MAIVATAGHVDHGKSTLVRALTGTDPDRLVEEKRRGLTLDLGFAWTDIDGRRVSLVDVPGHERYVSTMLAGVGPVSGVLLVVAADEGWRRQTEEHVDAIVALGMRHILLAVTRCDLADPAATLGDSRARLAARGLAPMDAVAVSASTGQGLDALRDGLGSLARTLPRGDPTAVVRLWVDRSFTIRGAGTVVTGSLAEGTLHVGDRLEVGGHPVVVRGLQSCDEPRQVVTGPARVAVNVRGVGAADVGRGDLLAVPGQAPGVRVLDVGLDRRPTRLPRRLTAHVGTAAVPVGTRQLDPRVVRLVVEGDHVLPTMAEDRLVLRDPGAHMVVSGGVVLRTNPPRRRDRLAPERPPRQRDPSETGLDELVAWLDAHPLAAPLGADLAAFGVSADALARGERQRRLLRLGGVVVAADTLQRAATELARIGGRFTVGEACRALGTTRRVGVPVLQRLDGLNVTSRHPDGTRTLRAPPRP